MKSLNLVGQRFGYLTVIDRVGSKPSLGSTRVIWLARCDCGKEIERPGTLLKNGKIRSCGCYRSKHHPQLKHGHARSGSHTREYNSWHHMRDRCLRPTSIKWKDYGARGITVCERWLVFENFYTDMGDCPKGHTLDRIDVNGNYEPGNCRWATPLMQSRNVRKNVYLTVNGETRPIWEWAEVTGIDARTLNMRRLRGWNDDQIVNTPKGVRRPNAA